MGSPEHAVPSAHPRVGGTGTTSGVIDGEQRPYGLASRTSAWSGLAPRRDSVEKRAGLARGGGYVPLDLPSRGRRRLLKWNESRGATDLGLHADTVAAVARLR